MAILLILLGVLLLYLYFRIFKVPKIGATCLCTGAPKTGKTTLAHRIAFKELRKRRIKVWIYNHFIHPLNKKKFPKRPRPLFYSLTPVSIPYVPLTRKLLYRQERFVYGSVIYIQEANLLADMMLFKDADMNERLDLLCKLIGHETKGGCLVYDTHCVADMHYAFKRVTSQYFYIHHNRKIPFFILLYVKECQYSEDNSVLTVNEGDVEDNLRCIVVPKSIFKKFDAYAFSSLTDNLPVVDSEVKTKDLKVRRFLTFRTYKSIPDEFTYQDKEVKNDVKASGKKSL